MPRPLNVVVVLFTRRLVRMSLLLCTDPVFVVTPSTHLPRFLCPLDSDSCFDRRNPRHHKLSNASTRSFANDNVSYNLVLTLYPYLSICLYKNRVID